LSFGRYVAIPEQVLDFIGPLTTTFFVVKILGGGGGGSLESALGCRFK